jgi:outer membrane receptor protein involved in Fe transport
MDGGGNGEFASTVSNYNFTSEQDSHEISLVSNFDGKFNFTVGLTYIDGEEPYDARGFNLHGAGSNEWMYTDTSAVCEANLEALYGPGGSLSGGENWLLRDLRTSAEAMAIAPGLGVKACPGSPELLHLSGTGQANFRANLNGQTSNFMGDSAYTSEGMYLNLEYQLDNNWQFFGGIRSDKDTKARATTGVAASFGSASARVTEDPSQACTAIESRDCFGIVSVTMRDGTIDGFEPKQGQTWKATTWNVGVEYTPTDSMMVYTRVSTGSRPGGFYGWGTMAEPWSWDAEEKTNYEVGVKGLYFDNQLQLEASVFHQDFDNHWVYASRFKTPEEQALDPFTSPLTSEVNGITGTTISGLELQGAWKITDSVTLRGFYNYLDTSVGDYNSIYPFAIPGQEAPWAQLFYDDADGNSIGPVWIREQFKEFGGNQLANQAEHKGSLTLAYAAPVPASMGSLEVLSIYSYTGKKYVELGNIDSYSIDPFKRLDLRFNWSSPSQKISATLWVQNLLDQAGLQNWSPREGIGGWGTVVEPREIGMTFTYRR